VRNKIYKDDDPFKVKMDDDDVFEKANSDDEYFYD
jgi:hypothetical protein